MMNNLITNKPSMTSLEISELVNSRHDSVKRTIERLVDARVIVQPPLVDEARNRLYGASADNAGIPLHR